ncbi:MAG: excinuclease ABC subunit UvrA, partial [Anaerolineae bacterium]|nr:excinuclease ABC subunit UvrA [Anaerolineae bacterium]
MYHDKLVIRGAQQHNLKDIDLVLPRHKLIVITGVSGSGKSSLAFDTLYAEGQRRYVESLSSYARQFLGQMEKPRIDFIGGLSPAIAIEQKAVSKNPRSTVGTVTEIYDYLRVLYARVGTPHCPQCGREVSAQSAQQIVSQVAQLPTGTAFQVLAPIVRGRKGTHEEVLKQAQADGYVRARIDGVQVDLAERIQLTKTKKHDIEIVVDRLLVPDPGSVAPEATDVASPATANPGSSGTGPQGAKADNWMTRLTDSIETALRLADGLVYVDVAGGELLSFSEENACPVCGISFPELTPQMFSFNSPHGMCPDCNGLGTKVEFDPELFIHPEKSIGDGAVRTWGEVHKKKSSGIYQAASQILAQFGFDLDTPWRELSQACQQAILYGGIKVTWHSESERGSWQGEWETEGIVNGTRRRYHQTRSEGMRRWYMTFMRELLCPTCQGKRLRPEALATTVAGRNIQEVTSLSIDEAVRWVASLWPEALRETEPLVDGEIGAVEPNPESTNLPTHRTSLSPEQFLIAEEVLKEIRERLQFMLNVGLHYLTLDRSAPTLSGGEGQRIRLASQVGCGLVGVLYILDEPSIGLHQRDNRRLLDTLEQLRDMGNTVLVVEHDAETMLTADWIVDLGPGAGVLGGWVVAEGPPEEIMANERSLTGRYLSGQVQVLSPNGSRRPVNGQWLSLVGARQNNLKNLDVRFPLGLFTCVTGVSGSGKSSLVSQTLHPALAQVLHQATRKAGDHERIEGLDAVDKVINITQDPIGRTPRSNPATYVGVFGDIRDLFAQVPQAKARGYKPGRFSFNVKGGRCEACKGHGQKQIEMHFLADVWVRCDVCKGSRYNRETLQIRYKGKNITETLDMDVNEALEHFSNIPKIQRKLQTLADVGLGYIKLGQSATTLSGGEAQRVKLAKELSRVSTGDTVYILDEPTTGLHFADIQKLLDVLHRLTDAGNTVIVIEHNLDVIKTADWIIDLGPEGGDGGGCIIAQGMPEEVATTPDSYTGRFLARTLAAMAQGPPHTERPADPPLDHSLQ